MATERKLKLFGHICRMRDDRLVKTSMFGRMDGKSVRGRPHREWLNDIMDWCITTDIAGLVGLHSHHLATDCVLCVEHQRANSQWTN